ncbi:MAG: hypothetical protein IJU00_00820, partial [Selenomonas sp.]|nr:hypothetical protein [Selenomonas sp.]
EAAFAELNAEYIELIGDARLRQKENEARFNENAELVRKHGKEIEGLLKNNLDKILKSVEDDVKECTKGITIIEKGLNDGCASIKEIVIMQNNVLEKINDVNTSVNEHKSEIVETLDRVSQKTENEVNRIDETINTGMLKIGDAIRENENIIAEQKETIRQDVAELKKEYLGKLTSVHVNLVDSFAALQKDEETKTKSRLAKFDMAIRDITQRLITMQEKVEESSRLIENKLDTQKEDVDKKHNSLVKAVSAEVKQLDREYSNMVATLANKANQVNEILLEIKKLYEDSSREQRNEKEKIQQVIDGQMDFKEKIEKLENWFGKSESIAEVLGRLEQRLESLRDMASMLQHNQEIIQKSTKIELQNGFLTEKKVTEDIQRQEVEIEQIESPVVSDGKEVEVVEPELEPNRTETIDDPMNNAQVLREFRDNVLYKEMMIKGDALKHEIYYAGDGSTKKTINYDDKGDVLYELQYYPNGEAKQRIEYIMRKGKREKMVTRFAPDGSKIS